MTNKRVPYVTLLGDLVKLYPYYTLTTETELLADVQSRTDKDNPNALTGAITVQHYSVRWGMKYYLYVCFENVDSPNALWHLYLPSYYNKYAKDTSHV